MSQTKIAATSLPGAPGQPRGHGGPWGPSSPSPPSGGGLPTRAAGRLEEPRGWREAAAIRARTCRRPRGPAVYNRGAMGSLGGPLLRPGEGFPRHNNPPGAAPHPQLRRGREQLRRCSGQGLRGAVLGSGRPQSCPRGEMGAVSPLPEGLGCQSCSMGAGRSSKSSLGSVHPGMGRACGRGAGGGGWAALGGLGVPVEGVRVVLVGGGVPVTARGPTCHRRSAGPYDGPRRCPRGAGRR